MIFYHMLECAVIVTGLLDPEFIPRLIESYKNINYKILSTWVHQDTDLLRHLEDNGFIIVVSEDPVHRTSVNFQNTSAMAGIARAEKDGYKYVFQTRTDMFPSDIQKFLECTKDLYMEKIMVLNGIDTGVVFYTDVLFVGPIQEIRRLRTPLQQPGDERCPELFLIESYSNKNNMTRDDIKSTFAFCADRCRQFDIEFIWHRNWENTDKWVCMIRKRFTDPIFFD